MSSAADTLALWRRSTFIWGETDCIMATMNHVREVTGIDPAAPWRGIYSDEAGAMGIYSAWGGVLALVTHGMALAGFRQGEATDGAAVVCRIGDKEVAGIVNGNRVAFMMERGCMETRAPILAAWPL